MPKRDLELEIRRGSQRQEIGGVTVIHCPAVSGHGDAKAGDFRKREAADRKDPFSRHADHHSLVPPPARSGGSAGGPQGGALCLGPGRPSGGPTTTTRYGAAHSYGGARA